MERFTPHSSEHLLPAGVHSGGHGQRPLSQRGRGPWGQACQCGSLRGRRPNPERRLAPLVPSFGRHGNVQGDNGESWTCRCRVAVSPAQPGPSSWAAGGAEQQKIQPLTRLCQPRGPFFSSSSSSFHTDSANQGGYNTNQTTWKGNKHPALLLFWVRDLLSRLLFLSLRVRCRWSEPTWRSRRRSERATAWGSSLTL